MFIRNDATPEYLNCNLWLPYWDSPQLAAPVSLAPNSLINTIWWTFLGKSQNITLLALSFPSQSQLAQVPHSMSLLKTLFLPLTLINANKLAWRRRWTHSERKQLHLGQKSNIMSKKILYCIIQTESWGIVKEVFLLDKSQGFT